MSFLKIEKELPKPEDAGSKNQIVDGFDPTSRPFFGELKSGDRYRGLGSVGQKVTVATEVVPGHYADKAKDIDIAMEAAEKAEAETATDAAAAAELVDANAPVDLTPLVTAREAPVAHPRPAEPSGNGDPKLA